MHIYTTPPSITAFSTTRDGESSLSIPRLFMPHHQVHGIRTVIIDEAFVHLSPLQQAIAMDGVDALATNLPMTCVCVKTADCIPVLLWDERSHVVAAVHAGWKGTLQRIVEHNIATLRSVYAICPSDIHAIIGPGIGPDSFEVGDEVYEQFVQSGFDMQLLSSRHPDMRNPQFYKWHIDLWECNRLQLIAQGVQPANIHVSAIDTFVHYDRFFSARRHLDGRIINGIMMNE